MCFGSVFLPGSFLVYFFFYFFLFFFYFFLFFLFYSFYFILFYRFSCFSSVTVWVDGSLKDSVSQEAETETMKGKKNLKCQILQKINTINKERKYIIGDINMSDIWKQGILIPKSKIKMYWDCIIGLFVIYTALTLPCELAFESYSKDNGKYLVFIDYTIYTLFFLDIIVNMNTAYYCEKYNAYVLLRKPIFVKYLKSWFFIDFIAFFPYDLVITLYLNLHGDNMNEKEKFHILVYVKVIRILRLVKLAKYLNITKNMNYMMDKANISPSILNIFYTLMNVLVIAHIMACIWWGVAAKMTYHPWFDSKYYTYADLKNSPFRVQYVTSLYLSLATLTTTGYGDISPKNTPERMLAIFVFILGALVYGYVTANVSTIIGKISKNEARINKFHSQIREYLDCEEISRKFLKEVTEHAKEIKRRCSTFDEKLLLGRLPNHLQLGL